MAGSHSDSTNKEEPDVEQVETGDKHQTEHEAPEPKRAKIEKQTTLDDSVVKLDDGDKDKRPQNDDDDKNGDKAESNDQKEAQPANGDSAVKPAEESNVPASILEKGIIYFFIRGRVGIENPGVVDDIARSHMILRPIEKDAKLGHGPIGDGGNTRLLALPKKVLPTSGKDRFMVFVEKSGASYEELKKDFLDSSDYQTKTAGTRHTPAATPVGEGVYAITSTGRESHLVYMLTLPEKLDEVQKELGLKDKDSFIISTKNPEYPGPANAQLPQSPDFPKTIIDEFRSLRWLPSKPAHFDYPNSQILIIGESSGIDQAVEPQKKDQKEGKKEPEEVLENLEEEDLNRMKHLAGDESASIFADLEVRAKDYPKLQTTF